MSLEDGCPSPFLPAHCYKECGKCWTVKAPICKRRPARMRLARKPAARKRRARVQSISCAPVVASNLRDVPWNFGQGHDPLQNSQFSANSRHPVYGTTRLILPDSNPTLAANRLHAKRAIRSHPRKDDPHCQTLKRCSHGLHHDVDGGSVRTILRMRSKTDRSPRGRAPLYG